MKRTEGGDCILCILFNISLVQSRRSHMRGRDLTFLLLEAITKFITMFQVFDFYGQHMEFTAIHIFVTKFELE